MSRISKGDASQGIPKLMSFTSITLVLYGLLSIGLGVEAYSKSPISLYAGGGAGILVLVGVWLAQKQPLWGYGLCGLVCLALLGRFLPAFIKNQTWLPAGIMTVASVIALVALVAGHFMQKKA